MSKVTRKKTVMASVAMAGSVSLLVAACSGDGDDGGDGDLGSVRIVHTSSIDPGETGEYVGPIEYGGEFGLAQKDDDVQIFDSHATASQVVLSGSADVVSGSFLSDLQIIENGEDLKAFCVASTGFDSRLVGVGDVTELEQVADPDTKLAIESAGGPVNFFTDLVLRARGVDIRTTEMTNVSIIEDSPLRVAALASGDVDVALINAFQVPQLVEQIGEENVHILSNVMEDVGQGGIFVVFAATSEYLDQNLEQASALCASVLKANDELKASFDLYKQYSDEYIEPDVDEDTLRQTWDAIVAADLWPSGNALTQEGVDSVVEVAVETGVLKAPLSYEDIVDPRPMERALEMLEENS